MLRELAREEMQRMGGAGDGNNGGDRIATMAEAPTARRRTASSLIERLKAMGYFRILVPARWLPVPLPWPAPWPAVTAVRLALRRPQPSST